MRRQRPRAQENNSEQTDRSVGSAEGEGGFAGAWLDLVVVGGGRIRLQWIGLCRARWPKMEDLVMPVVFHVMQQSSLSCFELVCFG